MVDRNDERSGLFASPPCFMHELEPGYLGLDDPAPSADVVRWRKAERERLIAERLELSADIRGQKANLIITALETAIEVMDDLIISIYWPIRGEPDLRDLVGRVISRGGQCALPVVVERGAPLIFRSWAPGDPLERGIWNIPVPAKGAEVMPDVVIAPIVGFDPACYRLGYGGGYFDRTLAALPRKPRVCGVGYKHAAIRTIYPQPHDIPMDVIVTEDGPVLPKAGARDDKP